MNQRARSTLTLGMALAAGLLTASCSKVFLQEDGFGEKLKAGCPDEASCQRLQIEAQQRVVRCMPNHVGYVRCSDAQADKLLADSYVAHYTDAKRQREEAGRLAEREQHRQDAERARNDARARERQVERDRLAAEAEREKRTLATCEAGQSGRAARQRRKEILETGKPGLVVQKQCAARSEMHTVTTECTDDHGFKRTCTKNVAGDVIGYACPKSMDEEVVQLGLYQLNLLDDYPYPDDRTGRRADQECDRARERAKQLSDRIERFAQ